MTVYRRVSTQNDLLCSVPNWQDSVPSRTWLGESGSQIRHMTVTGMHYLAWKPGLRLDLLERSELR
jgi:hypothetical protein